MVYLQPLFIAAPSLLLAALAFALGRPLVGVLVLASGAHEAFSAWRTARRRAAEEQPDEAEGPHGLVLTRADGHPRLWQLVDQSAAAAQIAPPARIILSLATTAAVAPIAPEADGSGCGALAHGEYELLLSPALLAETQVPQLQAVLAHEMGHVATGSLTDCASPGHRARRRMGRLYDSLPAWGLLRLGAWLHLRLWLPLEAWAKRPAEQAADDLAFRLAGPRTTAAALTVTDRIDVAQRLVEDQYLPLADRAGLRPSILAAVHEVLTTPAGGRLDAHLAAAQPGPLSMIHATHPTTAQRVAAAERAASDGRGVEADARAALGGHAAAADLLDGGWGWLVEHESELYVTGHAMLASPEADWASVVDVGSRGFLADHVHDLVDTATTPADAKGNRLPLDGPVRAPLAARPDEVTARLFLAAVDRVGVPAMLHEPDLDESGTLTVLSMVTARALDRGGRLRLSLSWTGPATCEYHDGTRWWLLTAMADDEDLPEGTVDSPLDAVLREVAAHRAPPAQLLHCLVEAGADVDAILGLSVAERGARPGEALAVESGLTVHRGDEQLGDAWIALIGSSGVWLVPDGARVSWLEMAERETETKERMLEVAHAYGLAGAPDLDRWPGSLWLPEVELREVRTRGALTPHVDLVGLAGQVTSLRLNNAAPRIGEQTALALREMVGNRLSVP